MMELKFLDMGRRNAKGKAPSFKTNKYKIIKKGNRTMAVTTAPSGKKATLFVAKGFKG